MATEYDAALRSDVTRETRHHELFRLADKVRSALFTLQMTDNSFHDDEASDALDALDELVAVAAKTRDSLADTQRAQRLGPLD